MLTVTTIRYPRAMYAVIKGAGADLTVLLDDALATSHSLQVSADNMREQAARLLRRADLIDQAVILAGAGHVTHREA
jgi:hypothetical protein